VNSITLRNKLVHSINFLLIIGLLVIPCIQGSVLEEEWHQQYGGEKYDGAYDILQSSDGGYVVAGYTRSHGAGNDDVLIVKVSENSTIEWDKTFGLEGIDRANAVLEHNQGYLIAGYTQSVTNGDFNFYLIKIDLDGELVWPKIYGGPGEDFATSVVATGDGGYAIAGYSNSFGSGDYDVVLMKVNAEGELIWNHHYGGTGDEYAFSLTQTHDNGYALAGMSSSYGRGNNDYWLVKTDQNGSMEWNGTYGGKEDDSAYALIQTKDQGFALAGDTTSFGAGHYDVWLVKTDQNGSMEWNRTYGGKEDDSAYALMQTEDQGFVLGGYHKALLSYNFIIITTDEQGYKQWSQQFSADHELFAFSMIQTRDEKYIFAGIEQFPIDTSIFILKTNHIQEVDTNLFPIADATSDATIQTDEELYFNGSGFDPDGTIVQYRWDFDGDGVYDFTSSSTGNTSYSYDDAGIYYAYFEVTDNNGSTAIDMRKINIPSEEKQGISAGISKELWIGSFFLITIIISLVMFYGIYKHHIGKYIFKSHLRYLKRLDSWTWYLIFIFTVIVVLKFSISFLFQAPVVYYDEYAYSLLAHDISQGSLMIIGEIQSQIPLTHPYPTGYSYFLAPAYIFGNNLNVVYHAMLLVNAILSTLLLFPVFFIMKKFVEKKLAFLSAILITVLPTVTIHNYLLLSENAFYLVFLLSCLLLIKIFNYKKLDKKFLCYVIVLGFAVRFLIMIKATGFAMLAALFFVILYTILKNRDKLSLIYGIALLPSLPIVVQFFTDSKTSIGYESFEYINRQIEASSHLSQFLKIILNEINYLILMSFFVFIAFTIILFIYWKKVHIEKKESLTVFSLYGFISIIFLILITANHIYRSQYSIYTRYVSVGLPIIFMLGIIGMNLFYKIKERIANLYLGSIIIILGFLSVLTFPIEHYKFENNLDLIWTSYLHNTSIFGIDGFAVLRILLTASFIFTFIFLTVRYLGLNKNKHRKKSSTEDFTIKKTLPFSSIVIISLIMCVPSINFTLSVNDDTLASSINEPAHWLTEHDSHASVIIEDAYSAFSGSGMYFRDWYFMYIGMFYWFLHGDITVANRSELEGILASRDYTAEYILSTHDLTEYFTSVKDIYMNLPVDPLRRQVKVDWHIYQV